MITDHRYEYQFGREGCGVLVGFEPVRGRYAGDHRCSKSEEEHHYKAHENDRDAGSLDVMQKARLANGGRGAVNEPPGKFARAAGDMHEPKPYTGELDWHEDLSKRDL